MHYKNGREAQVGDAVIGATYNLNGIQVGRVLAITPDLDTCNCTVAVVGNVARPIIEEYSQCDNLLRVDDAWEAAIRDITPAPARGQHPMKKFLDWLAYAILLSLAAAMIWSASIEPQPPNPPFGPLWFLVAVVAATWALKRIIKSK